MEIFFKKKILIEGLFSFFFIYVDKIHIFFFFIFHLVAQKF